MLTSLLPMVALSVCISSLSGCTRAATLVDEFEGKLQMSTEEKAVYRTQKWYPDSKLNLPFFGLEPALSEHLAGTSNGPGAVRLLHSSRKRSINYMEGSELVIRILDKANVKPHTVLPGSSRVLFTQKLLFLVSIDPAILIIAPKYPEFLTQMLNFRIPNRSFTLITSTPQEGYRVGSGVFLLNVFPDIAGIEVASDQWEGVRTLAQMETDKSAPFKAIPAADMPGFLRLVLKDTVKKHH